MSQDWSLFKATMEHASCNIIYVDRAVSQDRYIQAGTVSPENDAIPWETAHIADNVKLLLDVFGEGILTPLAAQVCQLGALANHRMQFICVAPEVPASRSG